MKIRDENLDKAAPYMAQLRHNSELILHGKWNYQRNLQGIDVSKTKQKVTRMEIRWNWYTFDELTTRQLYAILRLRQEIFVVEQCCPYQDCDNRDQHSLHLLGADPATGELLAYLRVIEPAAPGTAPVIGRLIVDSRFRGQGIARELLNRCLCHICRNMAEKWLVHEVRLSAQLYLVDFYRSAGFISEGDSYLEDDIPHIAMHKSLS